MGLTRCRAGLPADAPVLRCLLGHHIGHSNSLPEVGPRLAVQYNVTLGDGVGRLPEKGVHVLLACISESLV